MPAAKQADEFTLFYLFSDDQLKVILGYLRLERIKSFLKKELRKY
jgi:hypothetical protein